MNQGSALWPAATRHLKHVEGLRALACLVVFVNHAYGQTWFVEHGQFPSGPLSALTSSLVAGHLAVTVFIVISGFCLALPVIANGDQLRGGGKYFFKRRALRILPAYYGSGALCLALIYTIIGQPTATLWHLPFPVTRPHPTRFP